MGTAARKFHSSSLGRQPGSPFGDRTEHVLAPTDTSCGEDAFFHRNDALGIADGVGGWAGVGDADPALFARRLMHHASAEVARFEDIDDEQFAHYHAAAPVDILRRAYEITLDEMEALGVRGSSTACVVVLRGDELRVANLGDCSLTVVRQGDMLGTEEHSDGPSDAQVFRLKVQRGDIVIVGSDGVFDNLFDDDILDEVNQHLPAAMRAAVSPFHVDPRAISRAIAERAKLVSEDTRYAESPFQMRAMQEGLYYQGGKRDDISVIVAIVTDLEDSPDRR
ncbi:protein serine/threonine phosphatase 2C [Linderina pennispora]|uniref:Protein phosphatase n=1 Tax=Linderina pennispora TaxID=61395 RepID=A0A1Y1WDM2_9FUNG|nr:protein serine/threonine phosphatase 2C [Linderina pennispora]ORX71485.1 protein serine/threonine phosphatase 2C [Linderina pennispora]